MRKKSILKLNLKNNLPGIFKYSKRFAWIAGTLLAVTIVLAATAYLFYLATLPVDPDQDQFIEINIPSGTSSSQIANKLENEGLIHNAIIFQLYLRYQNANEGIQAGTYLLSPSMELSNIMNKLVEGEVEHQVEQITIPEGWEIEMMAERLYEKQLTNQRSFVEAAKEPGREIKEKFPFLKEVPDEVKYTLEGYLFPDTYEFSVDATEEEIIITMLQNLEQNWKEIEENSRGEEFNGDMHQVLTLASIIEREAKVSHEKEKISSVFHNRLEDETYPYLQACATVQYVLGERVEELSYAHLRSDHPYNTYEHPGLPPGPIASPGAKAIEAALYPADTDYLFFVAKEDGSGEHYFSETHEEHIEYKRKVRDNR